MNHSSRIISGGGWKDTRGQNVKVKAWSMLFLAIALGSAAVIGPDWFMPYACVLGGICLSLSVLFFFREKSTQVPFGRGDCDLRKLYSTSAGSKKHS